MWRAQLFPLLAAQLLLLPLTEVLRGGGAAAAAGGGGGGGGGVVQTRFEVLGGEEVGHTRVRAAAGVVAGELLRRRRPRELPHRLLGQPEQQLILHGLLLMRHERGGRGSCGRAGRAAARGDGEGGGGLREAGDRQRRWRQRAEGRGGRPGGEGPVRAAAGRGPGAAAAQQGSVQHPEPEVPHLSGRRPRQETHPVPCPA